MFWEENDGPLGGNRVADMRVTCALGWDVSDVALRPGRGHGERLPSFRFLKNAT
jgi:hypothetical protein